MSAQLETERAEYESQVRLSCPEHPRDDAVDD